MARHDRSYGVWFQSGRKGGSRRRKAGASVLASGRRGSRKSRYASKRDGRSAA